MRDGRPLGPREGAWCAGFVGLCDFETHAEHTWRASVHELVSDAVIARTWRELDYVPRPNDLAIFKRNWNNPRTFGEGHVEFVEVLPDESGTLTTIGGNVGDTVVRRTWRIGEEARGHELVGWIKRSGLSEEDRARTEVAQKHSLRSLLPQARRMMLSIKRAPFTMVQLLSFHTTGQRCQSNSCEHNSTQLNVSNGKTMVLPNHRPSASAGLNMLRSGMKHFLAMLIVIGLSCSSTKPDIGLGSSKPPPPPEPTQTSSAQPEPPPQPK
jgi:hypothetical protein